MQQYARSTTVFEIGVLPAARCRARQLLPETAGVFLNSSAKLFNFQSLIIKKRERNKRWKYFLVLNEKIIYLSKYFLSHFDDILVKPELQLPKNLVKKLMKSMNFFNITVQAGPTNWFQERPTFPFLDLPFSVHGNPFHHVLFSFSNFNKYNF